MDKAKGLGMVKGKVEEGGGGDIAIWKMTGAVVERKAMMISRMEER
jgi:hypothetical protein